MTEGEESRERETPETPEPQERGPKRLWIFTGLGIFLVLVPLALLLLGALFLYSTGYGYSAVGERYRNAHLRQPGPEETPDVLGAAAADAQKVLDKLQPKGVFIIIDRVANRLTLRDGDTVLLKAVISAGAGSVLEDPRDPTGQKKWVFDTPVGRFYVKHRRENPLWTAPDWEYIESGEPMPKNYADRTQEGMLGEYALDLGGGPPGYMIHGTIYTRLLGRNVSHGCIRVGRDDLRVVWKKVPVGSTVFMY
jgi:hypothetical protein